mgnify:FL=1
MNNATATAETMEIKITREYQRFNKLEGNRPISESHVRKLMNSMRQKDLFVPIQCNEQMEVVDGQHRLEARQRLGLVIPYFVVKGEFGLVEVQKINAQQKKWNTEDYLQSNLQQGNREYEVYKWFRNKYGFAHTESLQMLCKDFIGRELGQAFNLGLFRVKDLEGAKAKAEMLISIEHLYNGIRRRGFVQAMFFLWKKKNFDFKTFARKLEMQPTALKDCAKATQYVELIEEIYNYKSANKVSLKYSDEKEN